MIPEEKAAAMGIWNLPMDKLSASQISDMVGNAFEASQVLTVCAVRLSFLQLYKFAGKVSTPSGQRPQPPLSLWIKAGDEDHIELAWWQVAGLDHGQQITELHQPPHHLALDVVRAARPQQYN